MTTAIIVATGATAEEPALAGLVGLAGVLSFGGVSSSLPFLSPEDETCQYAEKMRQQSTSLNVTAVKIII